MSRPVHPSVIHIKGMDLAGKSTATTYLVAEGSRTLQRNSLAGNNRSYEAADQLRRDGASADRLAQLYVDAVAYDLDHLPTDSARVQDSTILLRSMAFNAALGFDQFVADFEALVPRHPIFGITIVLTATIEARIGRLAERQRLASEEVAPDDLMVLSKPELFTQMEKNLLGFASTYFGAVELDTSELSKVDVQDRLRQLIHEHAWSSQGLT